MQARAHDIEANSLSLLLEHDEQFPLERVALRSSTENVFDVVAVAALTCVCVLERGKKKPAKQAATREQQQTEKERVAALHRKVKRGGGRETFDWPTNYAALYSTGRYDAHTYIHMYVTVCVTVLTTKIILSMSCFTHTHTHTGTLFYIRTSIDSVLVCSG